MANVTDQNLLEDLAKAEGYSETTSMLEDNVFDSVVPGICTSCKGTQECEPDARANWCDDAGRTRFGPALILRE